jgi:hypothetical protein
MNSQSPNSRLISLILPIVALMAIESPSLILAALSRRSIQTEGLYWVDLWRRRPMGRWASISILLAAAIWLGGPIVSLCAADPVPTAVEASPPIEQPPEPKRPFSPAAIVPAEESVLVSPVSPAPKLLPTEVLPVPGPGVPVMPQQPPIDADRPITSLTTRIAPVAGVLPTNDAAVRFIGGVDPWVARPWNGNFYAWDAPGLCYGPLRYEEVNAERFGYSRCPPLQGVISAGHFLGSTLALPYSMAMHPCWECIYPLGHYRPGSPVPYRAHWPGWSNRGAAAECGAIAGIILLFP